MDFRGQLTDFDRSRYSRRDMAMVCIAHRSFSDAPRNAGSLRRRTMRLLLARYDGMVRERRYSRRDTAMVCDVHPTGL
jgi:hypothetical protein